MLGVSLQSFQREVFKEAPQQYFTLLVGLTVANLNLRRPHGWLLVSHQLMPMVMPKWAIVTSRFSEPDRPNHIKYEV